MKFVAIWVSAALSAISFAQTPSFDVASIKPSDPTKLAGMTIDAGRINIRGSFLRELIEYAYQIKYDQLLPTGYPEIQTFDVTATIPEGANRDQIPAMLQRLLAERFKLAVHPEKRDLPVYALVIGKNGVKFKEAATDADSAQPVKSYRKSAGVLHTDYLRASMPLFAERLRNYVDRLVVDQTGLKGYYQFSFEINLMEIGAAPRAQGDTAASDPGRGRNLVFQQVEALGLKLEPRKLPMDVIIIDHVEKIPTEN